MSQIVYGEQFLNRHKIFRLCPASWNARLGAINMARKDGSFHANPENIRIIYNPEGVEYFWFCRHSGAQWAYAKMINGKQSVISVIHCIDGIQVSRKKWHKYRRGLEVPLVKNGAKLD